MYIYIVDSCFDVNTNTDYRLALLIFSLSAHLLKKNFLNKLFKHSNSLGHQVG